VNLRRFVVLLCVAVLAIAAASWLGARRHVATRGEAGQPVEPGLKAAVNSVTRLRLTKGDGSHVTLVRRANDWLLEERGYPADSGRVRKLLLELADLAVVEEKTHDPHNYPLLGVDEPTSATAQGVLVEIGGGGSLPALIVGKPSGTKSVFVRRRGEPASYLASPQIALDTAARSWLDRTLLDVKAERVREITVTVPDAPPYTASRATRKEADFAVAPLPKGRELASPGAADASGAAFASFAFDDVRAATEAKAPYRAVVKTFDGLVLEFEGLQEGEHRQLRVHAHYDAAARVATADPPPLAAEKDVAAEAAAIEERGKGFEFELPAYRFDSIFRPLEALLAKKAPAGAAPRPAASPAGA
jgi:hypothetical protein